MKFIKKFESFHETGVDDVGGEKVPKHNPKIQKIVTDYIDDLSPNNKFKLFKWFGMDEPSPSEFDENFDKVKKSIINFFESNPNLNISEIDIDKFSIPRRNGDGIPRVQNIGGLHR